MKETEQERLRRTLAARQRFHEEIRRRLFEPWIVRKARRWWRVIRWCAVLALLAIAFLKLFLR